MEIYRQLTTDCEKKILLPQISVLHIIFLKIPNTKGHLTMLKVIAEIQGQTFI